jgi:hypothetical protein
MVAEKHDGLKVWAAVVADIALAVDERINLTGS